MHILFEHLWVVQSAEHEIVKQMAADLATSFMYVLLAIKQ
jgi:hypothetical protein